MQKKLQVLLFIFLANSFVTEPFVLNLLRDVGVICSTLSHINQINRKAVVNYVNQQVSQNEVDENMVPELEGSTRNGLLQDQGFSELAGDLPPEVHEIVGFLMSQPKYAAMGATMPKGVLLVGPPGTGKTSIARAIAHQAQASFFHASGSEFVEVYVGVGPQRVRELFDNARKSVKSGRYKTSIIFIDEIDSIGMKRTEFESSEYRNTLTELLNQMDGFKQDPSIIIIAATNKPESLDPALKRPGRFDRIVEVGLPSLESRRKILMHYCFKIKADRHDPLNYDELAQKTAGFTPAEIKNIVNEAAILAVRVNDDHVSMKHFEEVLKTARRFRR